MRRVGFIFLMSHSAPELSIEPVKSQGDLSPTSEVETADYADDTDKQELEGETGRMNLKSALQTKPVYHPCHPRNPRFLFRFPG
jgi:hypothetical protein